MLTTTFKEVTDASFEAKVLNARGPVLVCYKNADEEPPAFLEKFVEYYADRLTIVTLNIDENPSVAAKYGVFETPLLMLFKDKRSFS
ncbi:thioredoxin 1 [Pseudomonas sp. W3I7]|uniref:thioredoxin family protein n=1 Tax=Pseudomonas sp. W3I7 TaxID=3042292 RepID=UPI00278E225D|nr:thioredoxin domain-containing protein [Pseudomonas sp. W3I7]MDQ0703920.1 thioredoxin 1 [Pseudomonas sp. W3I7]